MSFEDTSSVIVKEGWVQKRGKYNYSGSYKLRVYASSLIQVNQLALEFYLHILQIFVL